MNVTSGSSVIDYIAIYKQQKINSDLQLEHNNNEIYEKNNKKLSLPLIQSPHSYINN